MSYMKREWEKRMIEQLHECYECESSFADILDLINHLREEHKQ